MGKKVDKETADQISELEMSRHNEDASKGSVYLFTVNKRYDIDGNVPWNSARLINHSCDPNCESDLIQERVWIMAKKDIKKGDELTYDYGYDLDDWENHKCLCGTEVCLGYIVGEEYRDDLRQILETKGLLPERHKQAQSKEGS